MNTETETMPEQEVAPAKTGFFSGLTDSISNSFSGIFGSKETRESLDTEKEKKQSEIDLINEKIRKLPADASADSKGPVIQSDDSMGGGRRRTKRSKRSRKTKRRRGKRSGKRTRR